MSGTDWKVNGDRRGILHRHADGSEHRHFAPGFTIGRQIVPDDDGRRPHSHGVGKRDTSGEVVWVDEMDASFRDSAAD